MKNVVVTAIISLMFVGPLAAEEIPFRLAKRHFVIVPVHVNGQGPYPFLLDTGSTTSLVDRKLAAELGLQALGETVVRTAAGTERAPLVRIDRIALGSQTARTVVALASSLEGIRSLDGKIRGVLGFNFLSRFHYLLDYESKRVVFDDDLAIEGTRLPFDASQSSIVLEAGGVRWLLDTGATGVFLFDSKVLDVQMNPRAVRGVSTNSGRKIARSGWIRELDIGDNSFHRLPATIAQQTGLEGRADGLLPGTLFASIYFDHAQNVVVFNPY